jgi:hypothetical protein
MTQAGAGTNRTSVLRQKLSLLSGHDRRSRSRRFLDHQNPAAPPDFTTLAAVPTWMMIDDLGKTTIAKYAALLAHREAIDRELSGKRLGALADAVGHDVMEALCDCVVPQVSDPLGRQGLLPRPEDLEEIGLPLLEAALPFALKDRFPGAADDPNARSLVAVATHIWQQTQGAAE